MSIITTKYLKLLLKNTSTLEDINTICRNRSELCRKNRELLCKKVLQVSGYKVHDFIDSCKIFKELLKLVRLINNNPGDNRLLMTPSLLRIIQERGSTELRAFMIYNGHEAIVRRRPTSSVKASIKEASTIDF